MPSTYAEQQAMRSRSEDARGRQNRATSLRAVKRHYADALARLTAPPVDPSGDAVIVRTDVAAFIVGRTEECDAVIAELEAMP